MNSTAKRKGFILFVDLHKITPYLEDLRLRDLSILVVAGRGGSSLAQKAISMVNVQDHPFASISSFSLRDGGDHSGIVMQATDWDQQYDIVGVLVAAEVFVEAGAVVCDLFGLPGVGFRAARVCRNKALQRCYLREWSPKSALVRIASGEDAQREQAERTAAQLTSETTRKSRFIVKPLTLESSIGVRVASSAAELSRIFAGLKPDAELLVEERVDGREYNVDAVVIDGKPMTTMITQKGTNEDSSEFFVELIHTTPPTNLKDGESQRIAEVHAAVIEKLDFKTGMAHAEYRLSEDGRVVLMEIAARAPGDACLPLYQLATGLAVEPTLIDAAIGQLTSYSAIPRRRARQVYLEHTPGVLKDVRLEWQGRGDPRWLAETTGVWPIIHPVDEWAPADLRELLVLKMHGEEMLPITDSSTRVITAIFDAPLGADIDAIEAKIRRAVTIDSDPLIE